MIRKKDKPKEAWRLEKIEIEFKRGWPHEQSQDRYEGIIKFANGQNESFQFRMPDDMAQPYIDLMAKDIVRTADGLAQRLKVSLGLAPPDFTFEESAPVHDVEESEMIGGDS